MTEMKSVHNISCILTIAAKLLAVALLLSLCSCHRRPLVDPENNIRLRVKIDIDNLKNVTCDIYNPQIPVPDTDPEMMHFILYDDDNSKIVTEMYMADKSVAEDGRTLFKSILQVAPGKYWLLAYNFGTEAAVVDNWYSPATALAHSTVVPERVSKLYAASKAGEDQSVIYEPEHIMVASELVDIPYHDDVYTIETVATPVVESWYVQIRVDGLQWVTGAQAFLSGMVSANYIAENRRVDNSPVAVWFPMVKSTDKGEDVICAVFNTFGHIEDSRNDLNVTFNLKTVDGKTQMHQFDISRLFETENAIKHHWLLLDNVIKIEEPSDVKGGGFDPIVGDWDEEHRDIVI